MSPLLASLLVLLALPSATAGRDRFNAIDTDRDGGLTLSEFLNHHHDISVSAENNLDDEERNTWQVTFNMMDDDNSGWLSRDEFHWHDADWEL